MAMVSPDDTEVKTGAEESSKFQDSEVHKKSAATP